MTQPNLIQFMKSISSSLERLFKIGGFALAFGFSGLVLILFAAITGNKLQIPTFAVGCALTFICLLYFVVTGLRTRSVVKRIKEDLPLLDTFQETTIKVTELASLIQSLAFKHLSKVQRAVELISPLVESFPVVGQAAKRAGITDVGKLSKVIVDSTEAAKEVLSEIEEAVRLGDVRRIKGYWKRLDDAIDNLKVALSKD